MKFRLALCLTAPLPSAFFTILLQTTLHHVIDKTHTIDASKPCHSILAGLNEHSFVTVTCERNNSEKRSTRRDGSELPGVIKKLRSTPRTTSSLFG